MGSKIFSINCASSKDLIEKRVENEVNSFLRKNPDFTINKIQYIQDINMLFIVVKKS